MIIIVSSNSSSSSSSSIGDWRCINCTVIKSVKLVKKNYFLQLQLEKVTSV